METLIGSVTGSEPLAEDAHPEGYETPEYPAALLDPRTCAQTLLHQLYTQATRPHPDRDQRDRDIFRCHQIGKSAEVLDKAFGLNVQQSRKIIRRGRCGR